MIKHDFKSLTRKKSIFSQKKARARRLKVVLGTFAILATSISLYQFMGDSPEVDSGQLSLVASDIDVEFDGEEGSLDLGFSSDTSNALVTVANNSNEVPATSAISASDLTTEKATLAAITPVAPSTITKAITVRDGDSLAKIFNREGYSASTLHYMMQSAKKDSTDKRLKSIRPGHTLEFVETASGDFLSLRYPYSASEALLISQEEEKSFSSTIEKKPITYKERFATASISSSFYNAGIDAQLPDGVIMELAGVFEYDIDFGLEIRKGDSFSVLYQEKYIDGKKVGYGDILSAEFTNEGDLYSAVQYTDVKGRTAYYTPDGKALRKSFLRAPLKFNYVSSNFNPKRFHPIQKRVKPHRGVDYRAATGTPVRAAGDGRVIRSTYDKYNGNYVFIQHGNNIVTKYLHFSKRAVKKGQRVKQGQIVGYVGNTGMSQASHLHYEFVVNGVHRNPRTVKLPHAAPVPKKEMARFKTATSKLIDNLTTQRTEYFARLPQDDSAKTFD